MILSVIVILKRSATAIYFNLLRSSVQSFDSNKLFNTQITKDLKVVIFVRMNEQ